MFIPITVICMMLASCKENDTTDVKTESQPVICDNLGNALIDTIDLTAYVNAWNSRDTNFLMSLYNTNALFFNDNEIIALKNNQAYDALVSGVVFSHYLKDFQGMRLRIIGCPYKVYNKLIAFSFRWENNAIGYTGVSILRLENDRIQLQVNSMNPAPEPNQPHDSLYIENNNLDPLFEIWAEKDPEKTFLFYTENAVILSDEDLLKVSWRDFKNPPTVIEAINGYGDWNPIALNQPLRIGDRVILAWQWSVFEYPLGHGVRILRYLDDRVDMDIRYGIRPWEAEGKPFDSFN
jgi:hypothetical protein